MKAFMEGPLAGAANSVPPVEGASLFLASCFLFFGSVHFCWGGEGARHVVFATIPKVVEGGYQKSHRLLKKPGGESCITRIFPWLF